MVGSTPTRFRQSLSGVKDVTKERGSKRQSSEILDAVPVPKQAAARTVAASLDLDVQSRRISTRRHGWAKNCIVTAERN